MSRMSRLKIGVCACEVHTLASWLVRVTEIEIHGGTRRMAKRPTRPALYFRSGVYLTGARPHMQKT